MQRLAYRRIQRALKRSIDLTHMTAFKRLDPRILNLLAKMAGLLESEIQNLLDAEEDKKK